MESSLFWPTIPEQGVSFGVWLIYTMSHCWRKMIFFPLAAVSYKSLLAYLPCWLLGFCLLCASTRLTHTVMVSTNPHQNSFFLHSIVINTETHNWRLFREWVTVEDLARTGMPLPYLFFQSQVFMRERIWKDFKSQIWWSTSMKQHFLDTARLLHAMN